MKKVLIKKSFPFIVFYEEIKEMEFYNVFLDGKKIFSIHLYDMKYVLTEIGLGGVLYTEDELPSNYDLDDLLFELQSKIENFIHSYNHKKMFSSS